MILFSVLFNMNLGFSVINLYYFNFKISFCPFDIVLKLILFLVMSFHSFFLHEGELSFSFQWLASFNFKAHLFLPAPYNLLKMVFLWTFKICYSIYIILCFAAN